MASTLREAITWAPSPIQASLVQFGLWSVLALCMADSL